jgi:hypothetical protein
MKYEVSRFFPLLVLYALIVIIFSSNTFEGDEGGYIEFAVRLSQGIFPPYDDVKLWWGPGYPFILAIFVLLKLPLFIARFLNIFFLFGAIVYVYKTLNLYLPNRYAVILSYLLGLYPPFIRAIHLLLTENLVYFLI